MAPTPLVDAPLAEERMRALCAAHARPVYFVLLS
jgi:hypothetical protein